VFVTLYSSSQKEASAAFTMQKNLKKRLSAL